jgi:hypothetical protein
MIQEKRIPYLKLILALSTGFVINNGLANGVVSGKYFWFYGSMSLITLVGIFNRKGRRGLLLWMYWFFGFFVSIASGKLANERIEKTIHSTILILLFRILSSLPLFFRRFHLNHIILITIYKLGKNNFERFGGCYRSAFCR